MFFENLRNYDANLRSEYSPSTIRFVTRNSSLTRVYINLIRIFPFALYIFVDTKKLSRGYVAARYCFFIIYAPLVSDLRAMDKIVTRPIRRQSLRGTYQEKKIYDAIRLFMFDGFFCLIKAVGNFENVRPSRFQIEKKNIRYA